MFILNKYTFREICNIEPQKANGEIYTYSPQSRYNNVANKPLHKYGADSFCKFIIPERCKKLAGIYILLVENRIVYIGKCGNLASRFNTGYGNISPRNCFVGGQSTNCKINKNVLSVAKENNDIKLFFLEKKLNQSEIEKELIQKIKPNWNTQLKFQN